MADDAETDAYWKLYADNFLHVRHHETQRSTVATAIVAIAGALVAVISYGGQFTWSDIPLAFVIIMLGLFGQDFSAKQWERATRHKVLAIAYRDAIDRKLGGVLSAIEENSDLAHNRNFEQFRVGLLHRMMTLGDPKRPYIHNGSVRRFWEVLYTFVTLVGVVLLLLAFFEDAPNHDWPWLSPPDVLRLEQVHPSR